MKVRERDREREEERMCERKREKRKNNKLEEKNINIISKRQTCPYQLEQQNMIKKSIFLPINQ